MKLDRLLFAAVLAMCAAVVLTALAPDPGAGGAEHPEYPTMRHGGPGLLEGGERDRALWAGWLFGVTVLTVFGALIAFGTRRHVRDLGWRLALAIAALIAAWTWVVVAYREYLDDPAPALYLSLPAPSAIMVYLFWPLTLAVVFLFVLGFRRWVLSDQDLEAYRRLLDARRQRRPPDQR